MTPTLKRIEIGTAANPAVLEVAGQRLSGRFIVTQNATTLELTVTLIGVNLNLASGAVVVTVGCDPDVPATPSCIPSTLKLDPTGVTAFMTGSIALNVPGITLTGDVEVRLNSTNGIRSISGGTPLTAVEIAPGISGCGRPTSTSTCSARRCHGDFAFEQVSLPLSPQAPPGLRGPEDRAAIVAQRR